MKKLTTKDTKCELVNLANMLKLFCWYFFNHTINDNESINEVDSDGTFSFDLGLEPRGRWFESHRILETIT